MSRERSYRRFLTSIAAADLTDEVRASIIARQDGRCFYCNEPIEGRKYVLDHFIPRSQGGPDGPENRVAAHPLCDAQKGARLPTLAERLKLKRQQGTL